MSVHPLYIEANGLLPIFSSCKKWTITCGKCKHVWIEKVPVGHSASAVCPCCEEQNIWDVVEWLDRYEKQRKQLEEEE